MCDCHLLPPFRFSLETHSKFSFAQDKEFFDKYLSGLVGEVFGEELMDKTKPDFYMVNFLRDDVLDEEGSLVGEAPKVRGGWDGGHGIDTRREDGCLSL